MPLTRVGPGENARPKHKRDFRGRFMVDPEKLPEIEVESVTERQLFDYLAALMRNRKAPSVALAAAKELLDRKFGKAAAVRADGITEPTTRQLAEISQMLLAHKRSITCPRCGMSGEQRIKHGTCESTHQADHQGVHEAHGGCLNWTSIKLTDDQVNEIVALHQRFYQAAIHAANAVGQHARAQGVEL